MQEQQLVWSQEQFRVSRHSLFLFLYCSQLTWYLLVVVPILPILQHGLFKDPPSFVTICTTQGLVVKVTRACMMDGLLNWLCVAQELPFSLSTFVHHLAQPKHLGIITWLLHCGSPATCAKDMAASIPRLIVAMNTQALCPISCMHNGWSQNALS